MPSPAHPNATRVFTNWALSKSGQMALGEGRQGKPLRTDVPYSGHPSLGLTGYTRLITSREADYRQAERDLSLGKAEAVFGKVKN